MLALLSRPKVVADERRCHRRQPHRPGAGWTGREILRVNLRPGDPWVFLDLSDGTSLPALGIQPGIAKQQRASRDARALRALAEARYAGDPSEADGADSGPPRLPHRPCLDYSGGGGVLVRLRPCTLPPGPRGTCDPRSDSLQRWTDRPVVPAPPSHPDIREAAALTIPLLLLAAAFLLILANGFFVAAEFGLVTVERPAAERAAAEGDRRARSVVEALRELSFQLSGTQLGITITSLVVGMLAEPALAELLAGPLTAIGLPEGAAPGVAVVLGMLLASAVQMVIGELVPEELGGLPAAAGRPRSSPARSSVFSRLFRPVIAAAQRRRQPAGPGAGRGARRGAGLRPHPRRAGLAGPPLRPGRAPSSRTPPTCSSAPCRSATSPRST